MAGSLIEDEGSELASEDNINKDEYYSSGIKLPRQDNYEIAYKDAVQELLKRDFINIALKSGTRIIGQDKFTELVVPFINEDIIVTYPQINLKYKNKNFELSLWYKILVLHYLIQADGIPATGEQITFKQITGGLAYYPAFHRRSIIPILNKFGNGLNNFIIASEKIGGVRSGNSNYSAFFQAFPRVPVIINLWEGDDELPADGNIVFDSSITSYLTTEDIAVLCNIIALMIIKAAP
jgi:hypothetical protein